MIYSCQMKVYLELIHSLVTKSNASLSTSRIWPSSRINWQVKGPVALPQLQLQFGFSGQAYEGLYHLAVTGEKTLTASFTSELEATAATDMINYSVLLLQEAEKPVKATILSVALHEDGNSVAITLDGVDESKDQRVTLEIANIPAKHGTAVFSGTAECNYRDSDEPCISPVKEKARRDLQFYRQLLEDPAVSQQVRLSVETTLTTDANIFSEEQFASFTEKWLVPVCTFLTNRSEGSTIITAPVETHSVTFNMNMAQLHPGELFRLGCSLIVHRGSKWNIMAITPSAEYTGATYDFLRFATRLESALRTEKWVLRVMQHTGNAVNAGSADSTELWAVRQGLQADQGISFTINKESAPEFFALRPISNRAESQLKVPICDFNPATGIDFTSPARHMNFADIDLDKWAELFFRSMDVFLSPEYLAAMEWVDAKLGTHYHSALPSRRAALADVVSKWLIPVFENDASDSAVVQEAFRQMLLTQLSAVYEMNAAVQLRTSVVAESPEDTVPRLSGPVAVVSGAAERKMNDEHSAASLEFTPAEMDIRPGSDVPFTFMMGWEQPPRDDHGACITTTDLSLQFSANRIGGVDPESWWLDFVTPEGNKAFTADTGKLEVPVLLRMNPHDAAPVLLGHSGQASGSPAVATFDSLFEWDYTMKYSRHVHLPHDILSFTLDFSGKQRPATGSVVPAEVFAPLAQFAMVFPSVERVFTGTLAKIDDDADASVIAICNRALDAFTGMTDRIVSAMTSKASPAPQEIPGNDNLNYRFKVKEGKAVIDNVEALVISIINKVPQGMGDPYIQLDDCITIPCTDNLPGNYCFYFKDNTGKVITPYEGQHRPMRTIVIPRINIMQRQMVKTQVALSRNEELVPGKLSAAPFVYRIGAAQFPDGCHPMIECNSEVDMSMLFPLDGKNNVMSLIEHFEHLFTAVIWQGEQPVMSLKIDSSYNYSIAAGLPNVTLPIIMLPFTNVDMRRRPYALGDVTLQKVIESLAETIKSWYRNHQPVENDASFGFDISFYSMLTGEPLPLLRMRSLSLGVKYVTDL